MSDRFCAHQELALAAGSYVLHLGVMDRTDQKMGALEVPITIPAPNSANK
jgi:hypothetical protein